MDNYEIKCSCGGIVKAEYSPDKYDYLVKCPKCKEWIEIHYIGDKIENEKYK